MRLSRRIGLLVSAVGILVASWIVVWFMPAPQGCPSVYCGFNFNEDALPQPFTFLNWQQLVVLVTGIMIFSLLLVVAFKRARS